jgi:hypothetical protein
MDERGVNQAGSSSGSPGARGGIVGGLILVMIGIGLLVAQFTEVGGVVVVLLLGVAFLIGAFLTRNYGFLVPGCILSGLGAGLIAEQLGVIGEPVVIGLGLGFLLIWVIDQLFTRAVPRQGRWWPLIPGGILLFVGLINSVGDLGQYSAYLWAGALIIVGGVIIIRALTGRGTGTS